MKKFIITLAGLTLVFVSITSIFQTWRHVNMTSKHANFVSKTILDNNFVFADNEIQVSDDIPIAHPAEKEQLEAQLKLSIDNRIVWEPSRAIVRPWLQNKGRYHSWYDAWFFESKLSGESGVWLTRRLQIRPEDDPKYQITVLSSDGTTETQIYTPRALSEDYRAFRSTQFIRDGDWDVFPLSVSDIAGFFPLVLFVFPIGTTIGGLILIFLATKRV